MNTEIVVAIIGSAGIVATGVISMMKVMFENQNKRNEVLHKKDVEERWKERCLLFEGVNLCNDGIITCIDALKKGKVNGELELVKAKAQTHQDKVNEYFMTR